MKANIHPQYYNEAQVICSCGNEFTIGSTIPVIRVELCSKCHPFYTGEQRFVDSASRIQKFQQKQTKASAYKVNAMKKKDEMKKKDNEPKTLREMLMAIK
ncbi:MAG: 50S ribosomal protein L31 [Patescibacteria group bacterium]|nr:50S ribosomal protein L31 [Patescibacteria group bacterium]